MHVFLIADMEGACGIVDHRECWPAFPHYWRTGRRRLTADVAAAVAGLFAGGATEVTVADSHGRDVWPNLVRERLPDRVHLAQHRSGDEWRHAGYDAAFHLGFHARCGTPAFMSHTHTTNIRIAVDGRPITENHHCAWTAEVPVLGVTGDAALGPQLDGALAGTPFLATKRSSRRAVATSLFPDSASGHETVRDFAAHCARHWRERGAPAVPVSCTLTFSLNPDLAGYAEGQHGLRRVSPAVLATESTDWHHEARPALRAALAAANRAWDEHDVALDLPSEEAMHDQDPVRLDHARCFLQDWMLAEEADWLV